MAAVMRKIRLPVLALRLMACGAGINAAVAQARAGFSR